MNTGHRDGNDSERSDVSLVVVRPAKEMSTLLAVDRPRDPRALVVVLLMAAGLTAVELVQEGPGADAEWVNRTLAAFQRTTTRATGRGGPAA